MFASSRLFCDQLQMAVWLIRNKILIYRFWSNTSNFSEDKNLSTNIWFLWPFSAWWLMATLVLGFDNEFVLYFSDINECTIGTHNCHRNPIEATCTNTIGSFTCACNTGYTGDGRTCTGLYESCCFWARSIFQIS
jgi:hypothetical protein